MVAVMRAELHTTSDVASVDLMAVLSTLQLVGIRLSSVSSDAKKTMIIAKGKINPNGGFVLLMNGETVYNVFSLVHWLDQNGMVPL